MSGPTTVAVIDDDEWRRYAMAELLDQSESIDVVHALDQDEAVTWATARWETVAVALIDIYDDTAPGEIGTDLYSGISAVEALAPLPVRVFAITPHTAHPLVQLRLAQARPDWTYHRWELPARNTLVESLLAPDHGHQAPSPAESVLRRFGAHRARANDAVRSYLASPLAGHLRPEIGHKSLPATRRHVDDLRRQIAETGFIGTEYLSGEDAAFRSARWPDVRDYILRLIGRLDAPPSEHDRQWVKSL